MKKLFLLCVALAFFAVIAAGQIATFDSDYRPPRFADPDRLRRIEDALPAIDSIYRGWADKNHIPGFAYGIVVDGKLIRKGAGGYADLETKNPATTASLFRIASMSKSFTAMAILKLRDEGRLGLDDPVSKYIPEMNGLRYPTSDSGVITIRHLLTHGAGFPEDNPWGDRQLADSDRELRALIAGQVSFSNAPGVEYEYSNLGFTLLGRIVTVVSRMPYQRYIRENVWRPLGMNASEWEYANVAPDKLAHGYRWLEGKWVEEELLHDKADGSWGAMGGMISSIDEFANYLALHVTAWPPSNEVDRGPLRRSSLREMHHPWRLGGFNPNFAYADGRKCPAVAAYGYGLNWLRDCDGRVYVGHSGGLPGFGSQWRFLPEYGIGVVAFGNRTYAPATAVNLEVLDTLIRSANLKPRRLPPSAILKRRQAELVALFPAWENALKSGIFAENFFADNPIEIVRRDFAELYRKAGKIKGVKEIEPENQLRGTFVIEGEDADIAVYFTLSPENPPLVQQLNARLVPKAR
jgi:CubicO group peptidase (beta-lactamase class C family)